VSGDLVVREARGEELESLTRLAEVAVPIDVVVAGGGVEPERVAEQLGGDRVFVAESEGRRAGYAAVSEHGDVLVLDQLVIAPTDQARHVGHTLLDWIEGYGVSRGLRAVRVPAAGADARARDFYTRRGYLPAAGELERELAHV
jgi:N-acetylglutamate synthase-like GNAT family acetyltransferase